MIKEYIRNYIIRSMIVGGLSLLGNNSQNSASDTLGNKFYNSILLEEINGKNLEKITKRNLLFYSEKDKTKYEVASNLNFKR